MARRRFDRALGARGKWYANLVMPIALYRGMMFSAR